MIGTLPRGAVHRFDKPRQQGVADLEVRRRLAGRYDSHAVTLAL
jgi:hypothetical protein